MTAGNKKHNAGIFERFAAWSTAATGSTSAFILACAVVVVWGVSGPLFHYSDTWQLTINTGTTIATFLMVFLIQRAQNKEALALQIKLNELIAAIAGASNRLIAVEDLSEGELKILHTHFQQLAEMAKRDYDINLSHSIEEATARHAEKHGKRRVRQRQ
jgi:low affinity Fe/Cu permease